MKFSFDSDTVQLRWALPILVAIGFVIAPFASKAMVIVMVLCFISAALTVSWTCSWKNENFILLLPLCAMGLSILWSISPDDTMKRLAKIVPLLLGLMTVLSLSDRHQLGERHGNLMVFAGLGLLLSIVIVINHAFDGGWLIATIKGNANALPHETNPALTVVAVALFAIAVINWRNGHKKIAVLLAILGPFALVYSDALAAAAAFFVALVAGGLAFMLPRKTVLLCMHMLGVLMFVVPICMLILDINFSVLAFDSLPPSALHRIEIYNFVLQSIAEKPLLGWGFGSSGDIPGGDMQLAQGWGERLPLHPHNGILQIWLELGAFGALCFWLVFEFIVRRLRSLDMDPFIFSAYCATVWGVIAVCLFAYSLWASWWLSFGLIMILVLKLGARPIPLKKAGS